SRNGGTCDSMQIATQPDQGQSLRLLNQLFDCDLLSEAELEHQIALMPDPTDRLADERGDDVHARFTSKKCDGGLEVANLWLQRRAVDRPNVRRVAHNQVESAVQAVENIGPDEGDSAVQTVACAVSA